MLSTPQPMLYLMSPAAMAWEAKWTACWLGPRRDGRDRDGEAREHHSEARQVRALLPSLRNNATDDVLYLCGIHAGAADEAVEGVGE